MIRKIMLVTILSLLAIICIPATLAQIDEVWTYESSNPLYSVDITSNGDKILAGGGGSQFIIIDPAAGTPDFTKKVTGTVASLAIADESGDIAIATGSKQLFLFDKNGDRKWNLGLDEEISDVDISPDGKLIVVGTMGGYVHLIDSDKEEVFAKRIDTLSILSVAINDAGDRIAAGSSTVYLLDTTGTELWSKAASRDINSIDIADDTIAAASGAGILYIYDMDGTELSSYEISSPLTSVSISASGRYIALGTKSTSLHLLEGRENPTPVFEHTLKREATGVSITDDGTHLVAVSEKGNMYYFNTGVEPDVVKIAEPEPEPAVIEDVVEDQPTEEDVPEEMPETPGFTGIIAISGLVLAALRRN